MKMRLIKLLLLTLLTCVAVPQAALANDPCSSIASTEPSQETRRFDNKKISFDIFANYRIMNTQWGLMVHTPWSYEVYTCQINSNYPGSYTENGVIIQVMSYKELTKFMHNFYHQGLYQNHIATNYPGTTAKMFVAQGSEAPVAFVPFVKNGKVILLEIPMSSNEDGTTSVEVDRMYKGSVDLIMSTIQVK